ncbi:hypothetical protein GGR56DRAFT_592542 [Xylariaceae sp. FL0804]|nr:hypothetical protein GGR56DRAFT_592542 [Xylariaceae sp. FL0804]
MSNGVSGNEWPESALQCVPGKKKKVTIQAIDPLCDSMPLTDYCCPLPLQMVYPSYLSPPFRTTKPHSHKTTKPSHSQGCIRDKMLHVGGWQGGYGRRASQPLPALPALPGFLCPTKASKVDPVLGPAGAIAGAAWRSPAFIMHIVKTSGFSLIIGGTRYMTSCLLLGPTGLPPPSAVDLPLRAHACSLRRAPTGPQPSVTVRLRHSSLHGADGSVTQILYPAYVCPAPRPPQAAPDLLRGLWQGHECRGREKGKHCHHPNAAPGPPGLHPLSLRGQSRQSLRAEENSSKDPWKILYLLRERT